MSNVEFISPTAERLFATASDVAYTSKISNLVVLTPNQVIFDYVMPNDGVNGKVLIWNSFIVDPQSTPVYQANLTSYQGHLNLTTSGLNLMQGIYTIAVTADGNANTVAATQTIVNGQVAQAGSSTLFVINKSLTNINTSFNSPANVIANQNVTWIILRSGSQLGKGTQLAVAPSLPGASSGFVQLPFAAGTLVAGQMYNVALNPGFSTVPMTAGYVFQYNIQ